MKIENQRAIAWGCLAGGAVLTAGVITAVAMNSLALLPIFGAGALITGVVVWLIIQKKGSTAEKIENTLKFPGPASLLGDLQLDKLLFEETKPPAWLKQIEIEHTLEELLKHLGHGRMPPMAPLINVRLPFFDDSLWEDNEDAIKKSHKRYYTSWELDRNFPLLPPFNNGEYQRDWIVPVLHWGNNHFWMTFIDYSTKEFIVADSMPGWAYDRRSKGEEAEGIADIKTWMDYIYKVNQEFEEDERRKLPSDFFTGWKTVYPYLPHAMQPSAWECGYICIFFTLWMAKRLPFSEWRTASDPHNAEEVKVVIQEFVTKVQAAYKNPTKSDKI